MVRAMLRSSGRNLKALERGLSAVLRRTVSAGIVVEETQRAHGAEVVEEKVEEQTPAAAAVSEPAPEAAPEVIAPPKPSVGGQKDLKKWIKDPSVRLVLEAFEGSVLDVRE